MLSDYAITEALTSGALTIDPLVPHRIQPSSIDVTLDRHFLQLRDGGPLDTRRDTTAEFEPFTLDPDEGILLSPGTFLLGTTVERFVFPKTLVGRVEGKSSLGRLGLLAHSTAGFVDPEFCGQITLELSVCHGRSLILYPGMPIAQVAFLPCPGVEYGYRGKYTQQTGPTASRYHQNWDGERWR
jgi:dCTP deaminase